TSIGGNRSFSSNWYAKFSWLEHSVEKDAGYCYPCRLFGTKDGLHHTFVSSGFLTWKHATGANGILTQHDKNIAHTGAMEAWLQYKLNRERHTSIGERMNSERAQVVTYNWHFLITIIEALLLCARQEIGLRGYRESQNDLNRGHFLEILSSTHDPVVKHKLANGLRNAIMGDLVSEKICTEVRQAGAFSILVDETKDIAKIEQVALVIRYVIPTTSEIHKRFLMYVKASSLNAKSMTEYITSTSEKYHLDVQKVVSQDMTAPV
uniref:TTF-type domain-containing protein n=2 Tax=Amphimedon queenslandica TaxID=400682 RepID=A0A1X7VHL5_AMPQE